MVRQLYGLPEVAADGFRFRDRQGLDAHNDWFMREKEREERREAGTESRLWYVNLVVKPFCTVQCRL